MKTDELRVTHEGAQIEKVLDKIELIALYADMSRREASSMRLLAEEMLAATNSILDQDSLLWMETSEDAFTVHLLIAKPAHREDRDKVIALSKSGEAEKPKGLFAKLGATLEKYMLLDNDDLAPQLFVDYSMYEGNIHNFHYPCCYHYLQTDDGKKPNAAKAKDDLSGIEKSIIDSIVDDILVAVNGGSIELIAVKNLKKGSAK